MKTHISTLAAIHALTFANDQLINKCGKAYCCYCGKKGKAIEFDARPEHFSKGDRTVFCRDCHVDCVIPAVMAKKLGWKIMRDFKHEYFGSVTRTKGIPKLPPLPEYDEFIEETWEDDDIA